MKKIYLILIILLGIVYAQQSECISECNQEYSERISAAEEMANQNKYYEAITTSNCPRITSEYYEHGAAGPGEYAKCAVYVWKCVSEGKGQDCTHDRGLQECCLSEAKISAKNSLDQCVSNCIKRYPEDKEIEEYESPKECDLVCEDYCEEDTLYYNGYCNATDNECYYYTIPCDYGCNPSKTECKKAPETGPANIELITSKEEILLKENSNKIKIKVKLLDKEGKPVQGAKVNIRIEDPENTGVLGRWGIFETTRYSNGNGEVEGTISFPTIDHINSIYYDKFPYNLNVEVIASKEEWTSKTSKGITLKSPLPRITNVEIDPNPAKPYYKHNLRISIEDEDSKTFTYSLRNYGGEWIKSEEPILINDRLYGFRTDKKNVIIGWMSPARGLNKDEIMLAREMEANLQGLTYNLAASGSSDIAEAISKKYAGKTLGKYAGNFVPIINSGKTLYGLYSNIKGLAGETYSLTHSKSFKEGAYHTLDIFLEGGRTTVGVITLMGKQVPVIGGLSGMTQDFIDTFVGSMQSKVRELAAEEKISNAKPHTDEYAFDIIVKDDDGYKTEYFYTFNMEYLGFEEGE